MVYKALDNLGAFKAWFGYQPSTKGATLIFGFCHGFGLATKILDFEVSPEGLVPNLIAFNVGVEIGQLIALAVAVLLLVTVVLPAEYGVDLTGVGRVIGLTRMGEIKTRLDKEAAADAAAAAAPDTTTTSPQQ